MAENLGIRKSEKRELIYNIIKSAPGPLSANDILKNANELKLSIGIATIYRTLKLLLSEDKLKAVNLPDGQPRYALPTEECLHYFHCKNCDIVLEIDHCCIHLHKDVVDGHKVDHHDITLTGTCKECV